MRYRVIRDAYLPSFDPDKPGGDLVAKTGEIVFGYIGATYGCISGHGIACSRESPTTTPFFEVHRDNLEDLDGG